ncbi:uncharacterized protein LOC127421515 [Myxocyprinus asiaticus]|uniref:uncharacterized protein LOC127421515 n=1 Tax=Myxocyprinus asiaticus TaxID=70543 RepID=UPI002222B666|nr:uncharacterized protein LOC127421515 [Myxocyprinus asiaticus]
MNGELFTFTSVRGNMAPTRHALLRSEEHKLTKTNQKIKLWIPAWSVLPGIHQFGVSLSGQMDMSDDNLTDIVVGAQGAIVLLKAWPVMSVSSQLSFNPSEISLNDLECPSADVFLAFNLTSCFNVTERTISIDYSECGVFHCTQSRADCRHKCSGRSYLMLYYSSDAVKVWIF